MSDAMGPSSELHTTEEQLAAEQTGGQDAAFGASIEAPLPPVAILGLGRMGRAILGGLIAPGVAVTGAVRATTASVASAGRLRQEFTGAVEVGALEADAAANTAAVVGARVVVIAVKPAKVLETLDGIADALEPDAVVVSVAAGVPIGAMAARVPAGVAVVRAMPNTPARIGLGVTGLAAADDEAAALAGRVFASVGSVVRVPEDRIDALSAISGSGPAYLFLFAEALEAAGVAEGLGAERSRELVVATLHGAAALLEREGAEPAELRRQVTSPNGTTERAIAVFEEADLRGATARAVGAAVARARELAAG